MDIPFLIFMLLPNEKSGNFLFEQFKILFLIVQYILFIRMTAAIVRTSMNQICNALACISFQCLQFCTGMKVATVR